MKIGKYHLNSVVSGQIALDGGAMFGVVPRALWERSCPPDDKNRIKLNTRCLLLKSKGKNVLVDTGIGENWDAKFEKIYGVDHSKNNLFSSLSEKNIKPDEITDVILTHLHFDHTGGSVIKDNDKFVPAFPNAAYHVQKKHFEWANEASEKDKASFVKERFMPLLEAGVLNLLNGDLEFDDEISFQLVDGHTYSQQLVKISDGSETCLYCGDLFPTASHIPLPYIMAYDLQPLKTLEEKKSVLPQAVEGDWKLFFEHDPEITAATVAHAMHGFGINEIFEEI